MQPFPGDFPENPAFLLARAAAARSMVVKQLVEAPGASFAAFIATTAWANAWLDVGSGVMCAVTVKYPVSAKPLQLPPKHHPNARQDCCAVLCVVGNSVSREAKPA
ncbi:hypothetical protein Q9233_004903 [Columba guinea]|nr:hypothetical protein Q9233_004903 [Columba guinea]